MRSVGILLKLLPAKPQQYPYEARTLDIVASQLSRDIMSIVEFPHKEATRPCLHLRMEARSLHYTPFTFMCNIIMDN